MSDQYTPVAAEPTSDEKLWVLLAYILSPIVPIIILLMEDKKKLPFIRAHNAQALVMGVLIAVLSGVLAAVIVGICIGVVGWILMIYWGIQGYQGKYVTIPVVTDFCKKQGWA
jgi:uncharacterized membrane protein